MAAPRDYCLGVFAKYWEPGRVKTRLAKSIGEAKAAGIYLGFLETIVERFGSTANRQSVLVFSPADRYSEFEQLVSKTNQDAWMLESQVDGDLGQRLERFFCTMLSKQEKVIVIGTDSPTLPTSYLHQAGRLLELHDVVLGPSEDGGYYLVGARGAVPPIFAGIDWSTEQVWRQTIGCLQEHRIKFAVLPAWYDVDTIDDLRRLQGDVSSHTSDSSEDDEGAARLIATCREFFS